MLEKKTAKSRQKKATRSTSALAGWLLLLAGLLAGVSPLTAQKPAEDPSLFFDTVEVNVVNVEVMVTDREGNPVTGLTREDFQIFEDGKAVAISNFFAVEGRQSVLAGAGPSDDGGDAILPTPETQRLNLVVYVDNYNIQPQNRNLIFTSLRDYLRHNLDGRDRVMLVTHDSSLQVTQAFTNDPEPLLAELDRLGKSAGNRTTYNQERRNLARQLQRAPLKDRPPPEAFGLSRDFEHAVSVASSLASEVETLAEIGHQRTRATLAALRAFTDMLAGMRGRKAVVYISDGVHRRAGEVLGQAWINKYESWAIENGLNQLLQPISFLRSMPHDANKEFRNLVEDASTNGVAFYPISNAGRMASTHVSAEFGAVSTTDGRGPRSIDVVVLENMNLESSLLEMADGTGGLAFTRTANVAGLLERLSQDFETFYSLGYQRPHEADGKFHKVEVKVQGRGLLARHLKGYRDKDPVAHLKDLTLSALRVGIAENPLDVSLDTGQQVKVKGKRYRVPVMIKIPFKALLLLPEEESHVAHLVAFVVAQDEKGGVSPLRQIELPIRVPNEMLLQALNQTATYPMELEMEEGRKKVSVGVRDRLGQVDATVTLNLTVGAGSE